MAVMRRGKLYEDMRPGEQFIYTLAELRPLSRTIQIPESISVIQNVVCEYFSTHPIRVVSARRTALTP